MSFTVYLPSTAKHHFHHKNTATNFIVSLVQTLSIRPAEYEVALVGIIFEDNITLPEETDRQFYAQKEYNDIKDLKHIDLELPEIIYHGKKHLVDTLNQVCVRSTDILSFEYDYLSDLVTIIVKNGSATFSKNLLDILGFKIYDLTSFRHFGNGRHTSIYNNSSIVHANKLLICCDIVTDVIYGNGDPPLLACVGFSSIKEGIQILNPIYTRISKSEIRSIENQIRSASLGNPRELLQFYGRSVATLHFRKITGIP